MPTILGSRHLKEKIIPARNDGIMNASPQRAEGRVSGTIPPCETAVEWLVTGVDTSSALSSVSRFTGAGGVVEWHVTVALTGDVRDPVGTLEDAWLATLDSAGINPESTIMRRVFCSDVVNQFAQLGSFSRSRPGAFSAIGQTPLAGGKFALWSQHIHDPNGSLAGSGGGACYSLDRGSICHRWISGLSDTTRPDAFSQASAVLQKHGQWLAQHDMTLADNVLRTWWFVRKIDADYQGLVEARRGHFANHGLTEKTHYIASTGIEGSHPDPSAGLSLDSYAIAGISAGQVEYLSAPDHLGPTHRYGVTFERATAVSYSDRRHIFISGTASINTAGDIMHHGDVIKQLDRSLENIAALLKNAKAGLDDLAVILVYLRDPADGRMVTSILGQRFPNLPMVLLHAPICRPGWLLEIEGIAIIATHQTEFPGF